MRHRHCLRNNVRHFVPIHGHALAWLYEYMGLMSGQRVRKLRKELRETEQRATAAEHRFAAIGDLAVAMFGEDKRQRIIAAHEQWPQLPAASVATIADASKSYVSEVLSSGNGREPVKEVA